MNKCYLCKKEIPELQQEIIRDGSVFVKLYEGEELAKNEELIEYKPNVCDDKQCQETASYEQSLWCIDESAQHSAQWGDSYYG
jgi:hypothetical protein